MSRIYGLVGYRPAGLQQPTLLSAIAVEANVQTIAFGARTVQESIRQEQTPGERRAQAWLQRELGRFHSVWQEELAEPSFTATLTISQAETLETPLFDVDDTLIAAVVHAAVVRALAEHAGVKLPVLADSIVIVGSIAADGGLSHRPHALAAIVQAASGVMDRPIDNKPATRCLIGPFFGYDSVIASELKALSMTIQPVRTVYELLRVVLGDHPDQILRPVLEQLALFDLRTQGDEAREWQALESRWAEHPQRYEGYVAKVKKRSFQSTVLQQAIAAAETLVAFRNGTDLDASQRLSTELGRGGYLLTAIWLLVRRSFLLRERRDGETADRCLAMAQGLQRRVPLAADSTVLLHQLGRSLYSQARFVDGLKLYWQGYQLLSAEARDDVPGADFYNSAGKCLNDLYQLSLAIELFEWARSVYERRGHVGKLLFNTGAQAEAYWRIGEYARAQELYEENLQHAIEAEQGKAEQPSIMRGKNNVALTLLAQGKAPEAELLYSETAAYYRLRYQAGNQREFGNLMFSVAGLVQVYAAQGKWKQVATLVAEHFPVAAQEIHPQKDIACLPVALLAFVNAQRLRRTGDYDNTARWLTTALNFLSHFYPMEHAMVRLEQLLLRMTAQTNTGGSGLDDYLTILQEVKDQVTTFLHVDSELVSRQFALLRGRFAHGVRSVADGELLHEREQLRRAELDANFMATFDHLRANKPAAAATSLRAIQAFVPYFRDLITQLHLRD